MDVTGTINMSLLMTKTVVDVVTLAVSMSHLPNKAEAGVVTVTVTVTVSLMLGEVEPEVRLNMTFPAWTGNGTKLPRVLFIHSWVDELPSP